MAATLSQSWVPQQRRIDSFSHAGVFPSYPAMALSIHSYQWSKPQAGIDVIAGFVVTECFIKQAISLPDSVRLIPTPSGPTLSYVRLGPRTHGSHHASCISFVKGKLSQPPPPHHPHPESAQPTVWPWNTILHLNKSPFLSAFQKLHMRRSCFNFSRIIDRFSGMRQAWKTFDVNVPRVRDWFVFFCSLRIWIEMYF